MSENIGCLMMALFVAGVFIITFVVEIAKAVAWIRWGFA